MQISTKCSIAVHCLIFIHVYSEEKKVTSNLLSSSTGCNPVVIRTIMSALKKAGIVSVPSGVGGTRLRRAPNQITLYQIAVSVDPDFLDKLMGTHPSPSSLCPVGRNIHAVLEQPYGKLREDIIQSMDSISLSEIIAEYEAIENP